MHIHDCLHHLEAALFYRINPWAFSINNTISCYALKSVMNTSWLVREVTRICLIKHHPPPADESGCFEGISYDRWRPADLEEANATHLAKVKAPLDLILMKIIWWSVISAGGGGWIIILKWISGSSGTHAVWIWQASSRLLSIWLNWILQKWPQWNPDWSNTAAGLANQYLPLVEWFP